MQKLCKSQCAKEHWSQGAREPKSKGTQEPRCHRVKEPLSQGAKVLRSQGARESRSLMYDTRVCLGTIGNVFCVPTVHPIAPTSLTKEANIIETN